jgi:hypothetical protein
MKKIVFLSLLILAAISCKKTEWAPKGPTDVRIRNLQGDLTFNEVIIQTAGGRDTTGNIKILGTVAPGTASEYARVTFAYPKAEISAMINGELYTTGSFLSTYMQYIGRQRITYDVYISNMDNKTLKINDVKFDEELILK